MEIAKAQYLSYFQKKKFKKETASVQYELRTNNSRLLKRIINPKRDPTITNSIKNVTIGSYGFANHIQRKYKTIKTKIKGKQNNDIHTHETQYEQLPQITKNNILQSRQSLRSTQQNNYGPFNGVINKIEYERRIRSLHTGIDDNHFISKHNHKQSPYKRGTKSSMTKTDPKRLISKKLGQFNLNLENQRMGRRLINAKSTIQQHKSMERSKNKPFTKGNSFISNQQQMHMINKNEKINFGIKHFFKGQMEIQQTLAGKNESLFRVSKYLHEESFGAGPTVLCLTNIHINLNPALKNGDLIALEILLNSSICHFDTTKNSQKNSKCILTRPFLYQQIRDNLKIKFMLNASKMGQFVPLKIWKYNGLDSFEIGIIDINLLPFLDRNLREQACTKQFQKMDRQCQNKFRYVYMNKIQNEPFRKTKALNVQGSANLCYKVYSKKFKLEQKV